MVPQISLDETVTYSDWSVYNYEIPDKSIPDVVTGTKFVLTNTLVKEYGQLSSIEIYGHESGNITIEVIDYFLSF